MAFTSIRRLALLVLVIGLPLGFVAGYLGVSRTVVYPVILAFGLVCGLGTYLYVRKLQSDGRYDERHESIQMHASTYTLAALWIVLFPLAFAELVFELDLPFGWILLGILFGSILLDELLIEWFRRRT